MRGILTRNKDSKIYADGRTYDGKLYTFKECDYRHVWHALDIMVKPNNTTQSNNEAKAAKKGVDQKEQTKKKKEQIDEALRLGGVPKLAHKDSEGEEEFSSSLEDDEDEDMYFDGNNN
jgi:hypothetical protein